MAMEVCIGMSPSQPLPPNLYVAVRIGDSQKQAKVIPGQTRSFAFPESSFGAFGHVQLFQRVGTASLKLDCQNIELEVPCSIPGFEALLVETLVKDDSQTVVADKKSRAKKRVDGAQRYLEDHNLEEVLSRAMREVIRTKPQNPGEYLSAQILKLDGKGKTPRFDAEQRPETPSKATRRTLPPIDKTILSEPALQNLGPVASDLRDAAKPSQQGDDMSLGKTAKPPMPTEDLNGLVVKEEVEPAELQQPEDVAKAGKPDDEAQPTPMRQPAETTLKPAERIEPADIHEVEQVDAPQPSEEAKPQGEFRTTDAAEEESLVAERRPAEEARPTDETPIAEALDGTKQSDAQHAAEEPAATESQAAEEAKFVESETADAPQEGKAGDELQIKDAGATQPERARQALTSAAHDGSLGVALTFVQPPQATVSTMLATPANVGDTKLDVVSSDDFKVGHVVIIDAGTSFEEDNQIAGFGSIILRYPLRYEHGAGTTITTKVGPAAAEPQAPKEEPKTAEEPEAVEAPKEDQPAAEAEAAEEPKPASEQQAAEGPKEEAESAEEPVAPKEEKPAAEVEPAEESKAAVESQEPEAPKEDAKAAKESEVVEAPNEDKPVAETEASQPARARLALTSAAHAGSLGVALTLVEPPTKGDAKAAEAPEPVEAPMEDKPVADAEPTEESKAAVEPDVLKDAGAIQPEMARLALTSAAHDGSLGVALTLVEPPKEDAKAADAPEPVEAPMEDKPVAEAEPTEEPKAAVEPDAPKEEAKLVEEPEAQAPKEDEIVAEAETIIEAAPAAEPPSADAPLEEVHKPMQYSMRPSVGPTPIMSSRARRAATVAVRSAVVATSPVSEAVEPPKEDKPIAEAASAEESKAAIEPEAAEAPTEEAKQAEEPEVVAEAPTEPTQVAEAVEPPKEDKPIAEAASAEESKAAIEPEAAEAPTEEAKQAEEPEVVAEAPTEEMQVAEAAEVPKEEKSAAEAESMENSKVASAPQMEEMPKKEVKPAENVQNEEDVVAEDPNEAASTNPMFSRRKISDLQTGEYVDKLLGLLSEREKEIEQLKLAAAEMQRGAEAETPEDSKPVGEPQAAEAPKEEGNAAEEPQVADLPKEDTPIADAKPMEEPEVAAEPQAEEAPKAEASSDLARKLQAKTMDLEALERKIAATESRLMAAGGEVLLDKGRYALSSAAHDGSLGVALVSTQCPVANMAPDQPQMEATPAEEPQAPEAPTEEKITAETESVEESKAAIEPRAAEAPSEEAKLAEEPEAAAEAQTEGNQVAEAEPTPEPTPVAEPPAPDAPLEEVNPAEEPETVDFPKEEKPAAEAGSTEESKVAGAGLSSSYGAITACTSADFGSSAVLASSFGSSAAAEEPVAPKEDKPVAEAEPAKESKATVGPKNAEAPMEEPKASEQVCISCGNLYLEDAMFCHKCGKKRPLEVVTAPAKVCCCGSIFVVDAIFCRMCGRKRPLEAEETQQEDVKPAEEPTATIPKEEDKATEAPPSVEAEETQQEDLKPAEEPTATIPKEEDRATEAPPSAEAEETQQEDVKPAEEPAATIPKEEDKATEAPPSAEAETTQQEDVKPAEEPTAPVPKEEVDATEAPPSAEVHKPMQYSMRPSVGPSPIMSSRARRAAPVAVGSTVVATSPVSEAAEVPKEKKSAAEAESLEKSKGAAEMPKEEVKPAENVPKEEDAVAEDPNEAASPNPMFSRRKISDLQTGEYVDKLLGLLSEKEKEIEQLKLAVAEMQRGA